MNLSTFKSNLTSKKTLVEIDDGNDDDGDVNVYRGDFEGEEEGQHDEFNDAGDIMEPFNLKNERDIGYFDENMNFVFRKDKSEVDGWLANLDEEEMEKAIGEAAAAAKLKKDKRDLDNSKEDNQPRKSPTQLKCELLDILRNKETVAGAMRRLSGRDKLVKANNGIKRRRPPQVSSEAAAMHTSVGGIDKAMLDRLTEIANDLLGHGYSGVYEMTYESIEASTVMWEYCSSTVSSASTVGTVSTMYGPYASQAIAEWKAQGYFTGSSAVMMRRVGLPGSVDMCSYYTAQAHAHAPAAAHVGSGNSDNISSLKRVRVEGTSEESAEKRSKVMDIQDIFDSDDDEVEGTSAGSIEVEIKVPVAFSSLPRGSWVSSDEIDFGDHTNILVSAQQQSNGRDDDDDDDHSDVEE